MIVTNKKQVQAYKEAGKVSTFILKQLKDATKAGVYPIEIDDLAFKLCKKNDVIPSFKGVSNGKSHYEHATCISVNDTVVHGIPDANRALQPGDIVKLDFGIIHNKLFTDHCVTVGIEKLSPNDQQLVEITKQAVLSAAKQAIAGNTTGLLGNIMHETALENGFDVLKNYIGHGIGLSLHEDPEIPAFGHPLRGTVLEKGMVICVEAQLVAGSDQVITAKDTWSVKTADGSNSAMFEYMVIVGKRQPKFLTPTQDWPLIV